MVAVIASFLWLFSDYDVFRIGVEGYPFPALTRLRL
jgi:hypothetical protein